MKLSVMSPVLNQMGLEEALAYLSSLGADALEIGAGGYPGQRAGPDFLCLKPGLYGVLPQPRL